MLLLISPAKKLDFDSVSPTTSFSQPRFLDEAQSLIDTLKQHSVDDIKALMKLSDNLAKLNWQRYQGFSRPFSEQNAKQALFAFKGDVYASMQAETFNQEQIDFADQHLRILSGLYGLLRPLDLMQPYRLEMGTKLTNARGSNLYEFWGEHITHAINQELSNMGSGTLVNLASNEYFKSVQTSALNAQLITPVFKEEKEGQYRVLGLFAKRARGAMCRFVIENGITQPSAMKRFDLEGYTFNDALTDKANAGEWVFTRKQPEKQS